MEAEGGNVTRDHAEEISLSALFLLEAAKRADREFGVDNSSSREVNVDVSKDVHTLAKHLCESKATLVVPGQDSPNFNDPTKSGLGKLCNESWVQQLNSG